MSSEHVQLASKLIKEFGSVNIKEIVNEAQLGPHAHRIGVLHWEDDEYVITVDGKVCGQTLHKPEAIRTAIWLSSSLGMIDQQAQ